MEGDLCGGRRVTAERRREIRVEVPSSMADSKDGNLNAVLKEAIDLVDSSKKVLLEMKV